MATDKICIVYGGRQQQRELYRLFIEKHIDEETHIFYDKKKFPSVMGSDDFRKSIHFKLPADPEIPEKLKSAPYFDPFSRLFRLYLLIVKRLLSTLDAKEKGNPIYLNLLLSKKIMSTWVKQLGLCLRFIY